MAERPCFRGCTVRTAMSPGALRIGELGPVRGSDKASYVDLVNPGLAQDRRGACAATPSALADARSASCSAAR